MSKRVVGVIMEKGNMIPVELEEYECVCIKNVKFIEPITIGDMHRIKPTYPDEFNKGEKYFFTVDVNSVNGYSVYIENHSSRFEEVDFNEHFMEISKYREGQINKII